MRRGPCALIIDAPTAVGAAVSVGLAQDGWSLVLHAGGDETGVERLAVRLEDLNAQAATVSGSFGSERAANALLSEVEERWGPPLVLVNNAGGIAERASAGTEGCWRDMAASHLAESVCALRRAIVPMRAAGFGRVVNVTTAAGGPDAGPLAALLELCDRVAPGLAAHGVTVNTVAAGVIRSSRRRHPRNGSLGDVPARRPGTPEEVAACVRFLAGPHAAYLTGQVLQVDGGASAARRRREQQTAAAA